MSQEKQGLLGRVNVDIDRLAAEALELQTRLDAVHAALAQKMRERRDLAFKSIREGGA